jgi:hypothetical protein
MIRWFECEPSALDVGEQVDLLSNEVWSLFLSRNGWEITRDA